MFAARATGLTVVNSENKRIRYSLRCRTGHRHYSRLHCNLASSCRAVPWVHQAIAEQALLTHTETV
jgi:hypothetical protein